MATVSSHYIQAAMGGALRHGIPQRELLRETGIAAEDLFNKDARIDGQKLVQLVQLIWLKLQDEFMGFTTNPCPNGVFSLMCDQVRHESKLFDLLKKAVHFYNLFTRDIQMDLTIKSGSLVQSFTFSDESLDPDHFYLEFWMTIWHRFPSWSIGEAITLKEVKLNYPQPSYIEELRLVFPCKLKFNQPMNQIIYDFSYCEKPMIRSGQEFREFLNRSPLDIITIPSDGTSLVANIRRQFEARHPSIPSIHQVASSYSITPQTLNKRLKQEGYNFQRIKDEYRLSKAINMLSSGLHSIQEISEELGYLEPRSFTRAFKRLTGASPRDYQPATRRTLDMRKLYWKNRT
ncbi:AraC family transcriptional regulator [Congregibacter litoralis]|nr:AraC family transcriptional regulator [Congregibacter litoralis]